MGRDKKEDNGYTLILFIGLLVVVIAVSESNNFGTKSINILSGKAINLDGGAKIGDPGPIGPPLPPDGKCVETEKQFTGEDYDFHQNAQCTSSLNNDITQHCTKASNDCISQANQYYCDPDCQKVLFGPTVQGSANSNNPNNCYEHPTQTWNIGPGGNIVFTQISGATVGCTAECTMRCLSHE